MTGAELKQGLVGARIVISNDYEFEIIREKTGMDERALLATAEAVVVTRGEKGASVMLRDRTIDVPAVPPAVMADPTGVGDAFRGGFMKGLAARADYEVCGRMGSVAAAYALEHMGGTAHHYTWAEFAARYAASFGPLVLPQGRP